MLSAFSSNGTGGYDLKGIWRAINVSKFSLVKILYYRI